MKNETEIEFILGTAAANVSKEKQRGGGGGLQLLPSVNAEYKLPQPGH
jgi:hypothetical protein